MKIIDWYRRCKSTKSYRKSATVGNNIKFGPVARCTNFANNPQRILIGDNSMVLGSMCVSKKAILRCATIFTLVPIQSLALKTELKLKDVSLSQTMSESMIITTIPLLPRLERI